MLPAQYRMRRSTDFATTVRRGVRAAQPDIVVHALVASRETTESPKIGLVVSKSVGGAVQRHRVSRVLRHVARDILSDLSLGDKVVIRALPGSGDATSSRLSDELRAALRRVNTTVGARR